MTDPYVLVADDDADLRELIRLTLEDAGMQVGEASNGREALALVKARRPNVVLLDLMMPLMDGWAFCRALHGHDNAPPIVVMTAAETPADVAEKLSAAAWLMKPFDLDTLVSSVRRYADGEASPGSGL